MTSTQTTATAMLIQSRRVRERRAAGMTPIVGQARVPGPGIETAGGCRPVRTRSQREERSGRLLAGYHAEKIIPYRSIAPDSTSPHRFGARTHRVSAIAMESKRPRRSDAMRRRRGRWMRGYFRAVLPDVAE